MADITFEMESAIKDVLADTSMGPVTKWTACLEKLKTVPGLVYNVLAHPSEVMCHPDNRGKLMLNAFNSHRNGATIRSVGADMSMLNKSTAFELSPTQVIREEAVRLNEKLISNSSGMLAPLFGKERFMSVGGGHTVAFCRAAIAGCCTPEASLKDPNGRLNQQMLTKSDPSFKEMLEKGWEWTIVSWQAEAQWPGLPDLAQRALNASNNVASHSTELETGSTISEFAEGMRQDGKEIDWTLCIEAAGASMPQCMPYISTIGDYVKYYSGGQGAPMIKFLDSFSKLFGANIKLGEEYLKAVTEAQFPSATLMFPFVRTALVATNLISPKVVDGIAKLLTPADVSRLKAKDQLSTLEGLETAMQHAWSVVQLHLHEHRFSDGTGCALIGRFLTRAILHACNKSKLGFEKKEYSAQP